MANLPELKNTAGTTTYLDGSTGNISNLSFDGNVTGGGFETGAAMTFRQSSAPTGWTKDTTYNDCCLRLVNGVISQRTTNVSFSSLHTRTSIDATTLTSAQIPSHTHLYTSIRGNFPSGQYMNTGAAQIAYQGFFTSQSALTGGSTGHTHSIDMRINYVDLILATRS